MNHIQIIRKKLIIFSCLTLLSTQMHAGFGGGFATGAILGTGVTLAATQGSRNANRDPYYEVDRERARQEAHEIREENRLKREEDRQRKRSERKQAEEERRLEQKRDHLTHEHKKRKHEASLNNDSQVSKKSRPNDYAQASDKKPIDHISRKELEIKKLELELKKLELEQLQAAA